MQLENCVYDFFELTSLNMAQQGVFGEVLHVEGAYIHNLEDFWPYYWNNWRMDYNQKHRGDVYATHGMGPACQVLNIHRGDRMKTLVAMDTKAVNGPAYIKKSTGKEVKDFQNGDQTTTLIRTENGKTMLIQHNVMTPRPYSRMYQVVGADGYASKYPIEEYCLRPSQRTGRNCQESRWTRRYGLYHGLSSGILSAQWFATGHGRLRPRRMVLYGRTDQTLHRKRFCSGRSS